MKKICITILLITALSLSIFTSEISAQDITNTLASGAYYFVKDAIYTYFTVKQSTGLVGIGRNVTDPRASLEAGGYDGLLVTGLINNGTARALGAGLRFHWYPRKGALRAGMAESNWWDDDGSSTPKMAIYSCAIGYQPRASGVASFALGAYNKSTGDYALSLGSYCSATASHAIAIGTQVYATGIYSIAIGSGADTNGKDGSMVVGDDTYFQTAYASADNQLTMRFSGGYRLWSSYPDSSSGAYMRHGQSGWSNYCDRNKKENFRSIDGEWILGKIKNIPISEWNYKMTDPNDKYIGPMAQDFYAAFHLGGTDSLGINTISIDGVNMAGVQALEKRTSEMKYEFEKNAGVVNAEIEKIKKQNAELTAENKKLREDIADIKRNEIDIAKIRMLKTELEEQIKIAKAKNEENNVIVAKRGISN